MQQNVLKHLIKIKSNSDKKNKQSKSIKLIAPVIFLYCAIVTVTKFLKCSILEIPVEVNKRDAKLLIIM